MLEAASWGFAVTLVLAVAGVAEAAAAAEFKAEGRSCCVWWWDGWVVAPALGPLAPREPRLLWKRLWKEMRPWRLPAARHFGLGMPLTEE